MDIYNLLQLNGVRAGQRLAKTISGHGYGSNAFVYTTYSGAGNNVNRLERYNRQGVRPVIALSEEIVEEWINARNDCLRYSMTTAVCTQWRMHGEEDLWRLMEEVYTDTYKSSTATAFVIRNPKPREVFVSAFRDRIVQHWVCRKLYPLFEECHKANGNVSYNCRKGFGVHLAASHVYNACADAYSEYRQGLREKPWIGKFDVRNFFMSIDKSVLLRLLEQLINERYSGNDKDVLIRLCRVCVEHSPLADYVFTGNADLLPLLPQDKRLINAKEGKGLVIGNVTSQLFANFYMSHLDAVMQRLCARHELPYHRFADDFTLVGNKADVLAASKAARRWLSLNLGLELHADKVYLQPIGHGALFCGTYVKPHRTYLGNRTMGNAYRQIRRVRRASNDVTEAPTDARLRKLRFEANVLTSYLGHIRRHSSYRTLRRMLDPCLAVIRKTCVINDDCLKVAVKNQYSIINYLKSNNYDY